MGQLRPARALKACDAERGWTGSGRWLLVRRRSAVDRGAHPRHARPPARRLDGVVGCRGGDGRRSVRPGPGVVARGRVGPDGQLRRRRRRGRVRAGGPIGGGRLGGRGPAGEVLWLGRDRREAVAHFAGDEVSIAPVLSTFGARGWLAEMVADWRPDLRLEDDPEWDHHAHPLAWLLERDLGETREWDVREWDFDEWAEADDEQRRQEIGVEAWEREERESHGLDRRHLVITRRSREHIRSLRAFDLPGDGSPSPHSSRRPEGPGPSTVGQPALRARCHRQER